jgi:hypothetical protein
MRLAVVIALVFVMMGIGCASYYKVTDIGSGKTYFTKDIDRNRDGSILFKDGSSSSTVTLQSSEVLEISKDEFKSNTGK